MLLDLLPVLAFAASTLAAMRRTPGTFTLDTADTYASELIPIACLIAFDRIR